MPMSYDDGDVSFQIVEEIGVLATYSTGWAKELNLVSWNGGQARYDIREWDPHHKRMSKGLTFEEKEMRILVDSLKKRRYGGSRVSKQEPEVKSQPEMASEPEPKSQPESPFLETEETIGEGEATDMTDSETL